MSSARRSATVVSGPDEPLARPPRWALESGLPAPHEGESLRSYCARIDVPFSPLVQGIKDPRALDVANLRLSNELRFRCPEAYTSYVRALSP
jgi:hypothetical protein